jgi:hypothetical protein
MQTVTGTSALTDLLKPFFLWNYLVERNPTGWPHTIQLGEPNCREPEALEESSK